jgi:hypothetical protein
MFEPHLVQSRWSPVVAHALRWRELWHAKRSKQKILCVCVVRANRQQPIANSDLRPGTSSLRSADLPEGRTQRASGTLYVCRELPIKSFHRADVAQLVEQSIRNRQVIGSSPIVGSSPSLFVSLSSSSRLCGLYATSSLANHILPLDAHAVNCHRPHAPLRVLHAKTKRPPGNRAAFSFKGE